MARKIQGEYPAMLTKQVYKAWTTMSETLWKRHNEQIQSARALLTGYDNNADLLTIPATGGIEQVAWVMKKLANVLRGRIVEIGINTTCKRYISISANV